MMVLDKLYTIYPREAVMPTITVRIDVPEGSTVTTEEGPDETLSQEAGTVETKTIPGGVERYWRSYLSDNGRACYGAAAKIERESGPGYTLNDVAEQMDRKYESVLSIHRTTGRSARKFKDDTGADAPIRLDWMEYEWNDSEGGMRTSYGLPEGVADEIATF